MAYSFAKASAVAEAMGDTVGALVADAGQRKATYCDNATQPDFKRNGSDFIPVYWWFDCLSPTEGADQKNSLHQAA